ncbi:MAG TPA: hypothetical protein VKM55_23885 [Candidatus Lokiarchaeia archaeon]|nr:hypothetical protein [Candidatus Lokiarchaeia archaeon]
MAIFIDTQIWIFAQKTPNEAKYQDPSDLESAREIFTAAHEFLEDQISSSQIAMTYHQLLEIYHALGFLGLKLPLDFVQHYCSMLLQASFMKWYEISREVMENALKMSAESGIHVWDFACVLPIYKDVTILYSCDKHFEHQSFKLLGVPIENPVKKWFIL